MQYELQKSPNGQSPRASLVSPLSPRRGSAGFADEATERNKLTSDRAKLGGEQSSQEAKSSVPKDLSSKVKNNPPNRPFPIILLLIIIGFILAIGALFLFHLRKKDKQDFGFQFY